MPVSGQRAADRQIPSRATEATSAAGATARKPQEGVAPIDLRRALCDKTKINSTYSGAVSPSLRPSRQEALDLVRDSTEATEGSGINCLHNGEAVGSLPGRRRTIHVNGYNAR